MLERTAGAFVSVTEHRLVSEDDDRRLFEVAVSGETIVGRLVCHGASPKSLVATPAELEVVADAPTTDVREAVEMVRESYPSAALRARRGVTHTARTP